MCENGESELLQCETQSLWLCSRRIPLFMGLRFNTLKETMPKRETYANSTKMSTVQFLIEFHVASTRSHGGLTSSKNSLWLVIMIGFIAPSFSVDKKWRLFSYLAFTIKSPSPGVLFLISLSVFKSSLDVRQKVLRTSFRTSSRARREFQIAPSLLYRYQRRRGRRSKMEHCHHAVNLTDVNLAKYYWWERR